MKKFFYPVLAAATMLFATTSCSEDDVVTPDVGHDGNTQKVTFKVEMPGEGVASRVIADGVNVGGGNQVDKLIWALYEKGKDNARLDFGFGTPIEKEDGKQVFTAEISMVKGLTYNVLFFAYDEDGCVFQLNTEDPDLTALKLKSDLEANVEGYDAFVKCHEHIVKSGTEVTEVILNRPFAQVNAATTVADLDRAEKLQAVVTKSELVIKNVPTQYNVLTGEATENADLTYSANDILKHYVAAGETEPTHPNEDITVDNAEYKYLAMAYVLAGATEDSKESLHDATFNFYRGANGDDLMRNIDIINLPIQRNHRTNVIGDLLTKTESFKIVIDEQFDEPDHNINGAEEDAETITVTTNEELQAALDAVTENSSTIIKLDAEITGDVTVTEKANAKIQIDGCDNKYDGTFTVYGGSDDQGATTIFKNIKFETSKENITFIWADASTSGDYRRYPDNIIVDNCSFNAVEGSDAVNNAVGLKIRALRDKLTITNTTANGMHTLLQTNSCDKEAEEILLENVTITNGKNGLSFRNSDAVVVSNTTIDATGYGIRADGYTNYSIEVQNCNIKAAYPFAVTNMSGQNYSIELKGNNTLTTDNNYQVIITNSKDEDNFEAPTGTYTLTGADNFNVYPRDVLAGTEEELIAALKSLKANAVIKLTQSITVTSKWDNRNNGAKTTVPVTIDGQNNTLKFVGEITDGNNYGAAFRFVAKAVVSNLTIDMSEATGKDLLLRAISSAAELSVDNCIFIGNNAHAKDNAIVVGDDNSSAQLNYNASITNCTFNNWRRGISDNENAKEVKSLLIEGNTFTNAPVYVSAYESIAFMGNKMNNSLANITSYTAAATAKVTATGNTLDANQTNVIGSSSKKFNSANVEAQEGFTVYTISE